VTRSRFFSVLVFLAAAPVFAQPKGEPYTPTGGKFAIRFHGAPKELTQTEKSKIGDLKVFTATYATSGGDVYMVSYTDFPEGAAKPENRGTLFDGIRDGLKGKDGKVISDKDVEVGPDKAPGRDIEIETEKGKKRMKFRVVLRDSRLYQVAVIGTPRFVADKDATAFLESFELTK
jgi:hypothetical protein